MGTMERIRQTSPYALAAFAVLFVGFMVLSDMGSNISSLFSGNQDMNTAIVGKVNGEEISYRSFDARLQAEIDRQVAEAKDPNFQVDNQKVNRQVWNSIIEELIIKQEAEKIGINVSNEEVIDVLIENPPQQLTQSFTDTSGQFNREMYLEIITNPDKLGELLGPNADQQQKEAQIAQFRMGLMEIEDNIRRQKMLQMLTATVTTATAIITDEFTRQQYVLDKGIADVDYIFYDVNSIPNDQVTVSQEDIKAYYDNNKDKFEQKAKRSAKYVTFRLVPSTNDTLRITKRVKIINDALNNVLTLEAKDSVFNVKMSEYGGEQVDYTLANDIDATLMNFFASMEKGQIIGPIRIKGATTFLRLDDMREGENQVTKASHILISFNDNKDSALAVANELLAKAKKGNFDELARENSQDKGSAMSGGDLGFFGKGKMVAEFEEAAFSANVGDIVGPVETQFGYHIIKVTDRKSQEYKYSEIALKPVITTETKNQLVRQAWAFKRTVEEGKNFDTVAVQNGLNPTPMGYVLKDQPIMGNQYLTDLVFEAKVGDLLEPTEIANNGIVVLIVEDARNAGIAPLAEVTDQIEKKLINAKKLDALKAKAEADYNMISSLQNIYSAQSMLAGVQVKSVSGLKNDGKISGQKDDFAFTTQAFLLPQGTINPPIRGTTGYFIMLVNQRQVPTLEETNANLAEFKKTLLEKSARPSLQDWYLNVRTNAEIEDYRVQFFRSY
jgi:peptidyl-prolyl cis-trans isomerase D